jgi:hypothetical protein
MKKIIARYWCDNCNKEVTKEKAKSNDFPYDMGWIEMTNFKAGIPKMPSVINMSDNFSMLELDDKEFCSRNCMLSFIDRHIKNSSTTTTIPDMDKSSHTMYCEEIDMMPQIKPMPRNESEFDRMLNNPQRRNERLDIVPDQPPQPIQPPKKRGMSEIIAVADTELLRV